MAPCQHQRAPRIHSGWPNRSRSALDLLTWNAAGTRPLWLRTRHLLDLLLRGIRRSGLGHRSVVPVPRRMASESAMRESKTAFSPCMLTPGRSTASATNSSTPSMSLDSFYYYGTDDLYLNYLARFVKPGGPIRHRRELASYRVIDSSIPKHLRDWWTNDLWCTALCTLVAPPPLERTKITDIQRSRIRCRTVARLAGLARGCIAPDVKRRSKLSKLTVGKYLGYVRTRAVRPPPNTNTARPNPVRAYAIHQKASLRTKALTQRREAVADARFVVA